MANFKYRYPQNTPGKFYVDDTCLDCDACRSTAPENFVRDDVVGCAYVIKQPVNEAQLQACIEAANSCPHESIGYDGNKFDWDKIRPPTSVEKLHEQALEFKMRQKAAKELRRKGQSHTQDHILKSNHAKLTFLALLHTLVAIFLFVVIGFSFPDPNPHFLHLTASQRYVLPTFWIIVGLLGLISTYCLKKRIYRPFSIFSATALCLFFPIGTVVGLRTIWVLTRPEIKSIYELK